MVHDKPQSGSSGERGVQGRIDADIDRTPVTPPIAGGQVGLGRFEELEAYRGIAAILMVVFHAYQYSREGMHLERYVYEGTPLHVFFSNLEVAVDWFFVLSGFLIFLPFGYAAINLGSRQSARGFLVRRAVRIVPLYYTAIVIVWTVDYTGDREEWVNLFQHLTFTQVFSREHIFWTIGPAWSLSVEVIFYLFMAGFGPIAYLICSRVATVRTRAFVLAAAIVTLGMVSVIYKWWAFYVARIPEDNWPVYFGPLAKLDTFAIGMLLVLAVVAPGGLRRMGRSVPVLLRLVALFLMIAIFLMHSRSSFVALYDHTLSGLAFVLVLASTVLVRSPMRQSAWATVLTNPWLQYLGLISYSVYMWHEPLMLGMSNHGILINPAPTAFPLNALILVAASIAVATVSYWVVERPAMHIRHLFTREGRLAKRYPGQGRG